MAILDPQVNWAEEYSVSHEYKTDIIVSRSGREQRRALRTSPRKAIEYTSLLSREKLRAFSRLLAMAHHMELETFDVTRFALLRSEVGPSSGFVTFSPRPPWMAVGSKVVFRWGSDIEYRTVSVVAGQTVSFASPTSRTWPIGTQVYQALVGTLDGTVKMRRSTNTIGSSSIKFNVTPASEPAVALPAAPHIFDGREVFLTKPNWLSPIDWTFQHDVETVDYGFGRIARYVPIEFETDIFAATYLSRTSEEAEALVAFFNRCLGRLGEFYMPTWMEDAVARVGISEGTSWIRLVGLEIRDAYADDTTRRALAVLTRSGRVLLNKIVSMASITDANGADTYVVTQSPWSESVALSDVLMICWLPLWRFATDTMTVEWTTESVAQTKLSLQTLETLP